ncbi:hypothetical protein ABZ894_23900, partial [Nocardia beijingensis]
VGGGSVIFSGAMIAPERRFFDHVFGGVVDYGASRTRRPLGREPGRERRMLGLASLETVGSASMVASRRTWRRKACQSW